MLYSYNYRRAVGSVKLQLVVSAELRLVQEMLPAKGATMVGMLTGKVLAFGITATPLAAK